MACCGGLRSLLPERCAVAVARPIQLDRVRIRELAEREERRLIDATPRSAELYRRALRSMTRGVPSSYQVRDPYPIYLREGRGSRVHDVDGREYVDVHNGFGAMVQGHAHPAIVRAVQERIARGSH